MCIFEFDDLCGRPVGAADFIAVADEFHTLALENVPIFDASSRSEAYRFLTLVDVLYEHRIRLFCSAEGGPFDLFSNIMTQQEAKERESKGVMIAYPLFSPSSCLSSMLIPSVLRFLLFLLTLIRDR